MRGMPRAEPPAVTALPSHGPQGRCQGPEPVDQDVTPHTSPAAARVFLHSVEEEREGQETLPWGSRTQILFVVALQSDRNGRAEVSSSVCHSFALALLQESRPSAPSSPEREAFLSRSLCRQQGWDSDCLAGLEVVLLPVIPTRCCHPGVCMCVKSLPINHLRGGRHVPT